MHTQVTYGQQFKMHYWYFKQSKVNWLLILAFMAMGCYGLWQGYNTKQKQIETIQAFQKEKLDAFNSGKAGMYADTLTESGKKKYKESSNIFEASWILNLPVCKYPSNTSIFNIGQSDVYPYYYNFRAESFIMQLFKQTEITNPLRSISGHFDITFWIIYLLPLLLMLLTFNTLSSEKDNGNWKLIISQGITAKKWLFTKFIMAGVMIGLMMMLFFVSGMVLNSICFKQSPGLNEVLFILGAVVYIFFWAALFCFTNSLGKTTGYNALVSGICWVLVCLLMPAIVSKIAESAIAVDNSKISTFSRRPQDRRMDDSSHFSASLIDSFAKLEPAYKNADTISSKPAFTLRVFYSLHSILHNQRWPLVVQYHQAVEKRQAFTNQSIIINPAAGIDGFLANLSGNDVYSNVGFVNQALVFHKQLQNAYYPPLFEDRSFMKSDYEKIPVFKYKQMATGFTPILNIFLLFLLSLIIFFMACKKLEVYTV